MWDGSERVLATLASYASAEAYGQMMAESLARNDRERAWRGVPTSGVQAITVGWDVFDIPAMVLAVSSGVRPVPDDVPPEEARAQARALALKYKDTLRYAHYQREEDHGLSA